MLKSICYFYLKLKFNWHFTSANPIFTDIRRFLLMLIMCCSVCSTGNPLVKKISTYLLCWNLHCIVCVWGEDGKEVCEQTVNREVNEHKHVSYRTFEECYNGNQETTYIINNCKQQKLLLFSIGKSDSFVWIDLPMQNVVRLCRMNK